LEDVGVRFSLLKKLFTEALYPLGAGIFFPWGKVAGA